MVIHHKGATDVTKPSAESDTRLVYEVPEAGEMLGLTRNASYEAAKRGDIPTIKFGKLIKVPKAAFNRMLERAGAK
jgi:excisionase family DNA binding protein